MNNYKKLIFIGAGPASLLAGNILWKNGFHDFLILEKGLGVHERNKYDKNENICSSINGIGGAGLFSDGKLNFSPQIGGLPLKIMSSDRYQKWSEELKNLIPAKIVETDFSGIENFNKSNKDINFLAIEQRHVGTDYLPAIVDRLIDGFEKNILTDVDVTDVTKKDFGFEIILADGRTLECEELVVATGQRGAAFAKKLAVKMGVNVSSVVADIGVRLETEKNMFKALIDLQYDPKIYFKFGNKPTVRTFCTNPGGDVIVENKGDYVTINGHASITDQTDFTNTALMCRIENLENPKEYTEKLCRRISSVTGNKIGVQDISELIDTKPCSFKIRIPYVKMDIREYYDSLAYEPIVETLKKLNKILDKKLEGYIYFPEVKLYNDHIDIKKDSLEAQGTKGLYFLGDCCGVIHGLTNACLAGQSFAHTYLENI
mgnify:CR=1 FL=1